MAAAPIVGILLAAGAGRRFGSDKLCHPLAGGIPLAVVAARRLRAVCAQTLVVVRADNLALAALLAAEGCRVVPSEQAHRGMGHSLAAGVAASAAAGGWLIALADMPFIRPPIYQKVLAALRAGAAIAAPEFKQRRGHPVGFDGRWYAQLLALEGDSGARELLLAHARQITVVPVADPGILRDVDTLRDLS